MTSHVTFKAERHPIDFIVIDKSSDMFDIQTTHFTLRDVHLREITTIPLAYAGLANSKFNLRIITKDEKLEESLYKLLSNVFMRSIPDSHYFDPNHPSIINYLTNLSNKQTFSRCGDLHSLHNVMKDKHLIYCGAGPSLKQHIETIRKISESRSHYIAAGGSALRILHNEGIRVDIAIAFDPYETEWTTVFSHLTKDWMKDAILVQYPYLDNKCHSHWSGDRVMLGWKDNRHDKTIEDLPSIQDGGKSVSTFIPVLAQYMACKNLTLVGTDLCLSNGNYYSDGANIEIKGVTEYQGKTTTHGLIRESKLIAQASMNTSYEKYNISNGLNIEGYIHKRDIKVSNRAYPPISIDYLPSRHYDQIEASIAQIDIDCNTILYKGIKSTESINTLLYQSILKSYDLVFSLREIWTGRYEREKIQGIIKSIRNTINRT